MGNRRLTLRLGSSGSLNACVALGLILLILPLNLGAAETATLDCPHINSSAPLPSADLDSLTTSTACIMPELVVSASPNMAALADIPGVNSCACGAIMSVVKSSVGVLELVAHPGQATLGIFRFLADPSETYSAISAALHRDVKNFDAVDPELKASLVCDVLTQVLLLVVPAAAASKVSVARYAGELAKASSKAGDAVDTAQGLKAAAALRERTIGAAGGANAGRGALSLTPEAKAIQSKGLVSEQYVTSHFDEGSFNDAAWTLSKQFSFEPGNSLYRGMRMSPEDLDDLLKNGLKVSKTANSERIDFASLPEDAVNYAFFPAFRSGATQGKFYVVMVELDASKAAPGLRGAVVKSFSSDIPPDWIRGVYVYDPTATDQSQAFVEVARNPNP